MPDDIGWINIVVGITKGSYSDLFLLTLLPLIITSFFCLHQVNGLINVVSVLTPGVAYEFVCTLSTLNILFTTLSSCCQLSLIPSSGWSFNLSLSPTLIVSTTSTVVESTSEPL